MWHGSGFGLVRGRDVHEVDVAWVLGFDHARGLSTSCDVTLQSRQRRSDRISHGPKRVPERVTKGERGASASSAILIR